jgi:transcriptional regulator with XRE-family HTH domain
MDVLTEAQCRAARGLLDWTQDVLAASAGVSRSTVRDFESGKHRLHPTTRRRIVTALETAGVLFIAADNEGAGVRLRGLDGTTPAILPST